MSWVESSCSSCGAFHHYTESCDGFFPVQDGDVYGHQYSSVDCTLSLGTPSTRLSEEDGTRERFYRPDHSQRSARTASFWSHSDYRSNNKSSTNRGGCSNYKDPLLARRCSNCDTTSTPLWRNGPKGPKSLCNACGIRFKKEEKRSSGAAAGATEVHHNYHSNVGYYNYGYNYNYNYNYDYDQYNAGGTSSWGHQAPELTHYHHHHQESGPVDDGSGFRLQTDENSNVIPFPSWTFNVADNRASLLHDFIR